MATTALNSPLRGARPRLPAVDRALSLLEVLSDSHTGMTLAELSRTLRIPVSTAHYLVHTLATRGYIQHESDGRHYSLGIRLTDIAGSSCARNDLSALVTPFLREAAQRLNLTSIAAVLLGAEAQIIGKIVCPADDRGGAWIGRHIDLHCTAQGKALIAHLPENRLYEIFRGRALAHFTAKTISNFGALRRHLAVVRDRGFAVNDEEHVLGARAIAAPVFANCASTIAAVSVRGSTSEIPPSRIDQLGAEMMRLAAEVLQKLARDRSAQLPVQ